MARPPAGFFKEGSKTKPRFPRRVKPPPAGRIVGVRPLLSSRKVDIKINRYPSKSGVNRGGKFLLTVDGKTVGDGAIEFNHKDTTYPMSGFMPAGTAVLDSIEVDDKYKGKGYGKLLLTKMEESAKANGMKIVFATHVMDNAIAWWEKQGYRATGKGRVYRKVL